MRASTVSVQPRIRAAVLAAYAPLASSLGLDVAAELARAGLSLTMLDDPEHMVPIQRVNALLENSAIRSGCVAFGLRMSERLDLQRMGLIGLLANEKKTAGEALVAMVSNVRLHNEAVSVWIEPIDTRVAIHLDFLGRAARPMTQMTEMAMGTLFRNFRRIAGEGDNGWQVCFRHPAPADSSEHRRVFGRNVSFNADIDATICLASSLRRRNPLYLPASGDRIAQWRASGLLPADGDIIDLAQRVTCALMPSGECTSDNVAARLGMNRRTLHRHMAARGETFMGLLTSLRVEFAMRLLVSDERSIGSVAALLGFGSQSDFANWFRKHFGMSASAWRKLPQPALAPTAEVSQKTK